MKDIKNIGNKAVEYLSPFVTSISGIPGRKSETPKFIGTGSYLSFNGHTYVISAEHVEDNLTKFHYLFHGAGGKSFPIQGHWVSTKLPEADFGVMGCFHEVLTAKEKVIEYTPELFRGNHTEEAVYLIMGFPGRLHTALPFSNTHQFVLKPILTKLHEYDKESTTFSIRYSSENVDPRGMSGSIIWNLNLHNLDKDEKWSVDRITIAGMLTRWDPENQLLIATRAEIIDKVLLEVTEKFREIYPRDDT